MIGCSDRPIRIAGASGSVSDRRYAMASFARQYPSEPVEVIVCDYMSEGTMAPSAIRKASNAKSPLGDPKPAHLLDPVGPAYEATFLEAIELSLGDLAKYGIRVAVNAGASDTEKCYDMLVRMIKTQELNIPAAWISGGDVLLVIEEGLRNGYSSLKSIYTDESLNDWTSRFDIFDAQACPGGFGVTQAFIQAAQIVIGGRLADASPIIGAVTWWHGWAAQDIFQLANALNMGHLLECNTYVTGGNYSGFQELENTGPNGWTELGFPIGEIDKEGNVVMTKQKGTGGILSVETCASQLLYEIQGPWYFNCNVTAVLNDIHFEQIGPDRVALRGVQALPPPPTTKVGITALGGYQAEMTWLLTGLDTSAKARMLEAQLRSALRPYSNNYTLLKCHTIGSVMPDADTQDAATVIFRIFAQARTAEDLAPGKFLRPMTDNTMQCQPGGTYHLEIRQGLPKPFYEYYAVLIPRDRIRHVVHFGGHETVLNPPTETHLFPERQPSQTATDEAPSILDFGPTKSHALGTIVYARSGDKGPDCNVGLFVPREDEYEWLRRLLSIDAIKDLLSRDYSTRKDEIQIDRCELPSLKAVHFLQRNYLDRGVTSTSGIDFLGKNVAEFLRQRVVDVPVKFLERRNI